MKISTSCKITLLGDAAVGKTALRNRFMGKSFNTRYMITTGAAIASKMVNIGEEEIKFQVWDLAGQPRYEAVRGMYYRGARGAVIVFDITRRETLESCSSWMQELWNNSGKGKVPLIILGNKLDLRDGCPEGVPPEVGEALAKAASEDYSDNGISVSYLETSAKTGLNVDRAFFLLGKKILTFIEGKRREG
ncbi:MAG: GTP-binding protein [Candidatus Heimdallarchaeota archaeon]